MNNAVFRASLVFIGVWFLTGSLIRGGNSDAPILVANLVSVLMLLSIMASGIITSFDGFVKFFKRKQYASGMILGGAVFVIDAVFNEGKFETFSSFTSALLIIPLMVLLAAVSVVSYMRRSETKAGKRSTHKEALVFVVHRYDTGHPYHNVSFGENLNDPKNQRRFSKWKNAIKFAVAKARELGLDEVTIDHPDAANGTFKLSKVPELGE